MQEVGGSIPPGSTNFQEDFGRRVENKFQNRPAFNEVHLGEGKKFYSVPIV